MAYYVYILARARNSTLYTGMTNDLVRRVYQHKEGLIPGFTKRYGIKQLVYYEIYEEAEKAILREKQIKRWSRAIKYQAIGKMNPKWEDLYEKIL